MKLSKEESIKYVNVFAILNESQVVFLCVQKGLKKKKKQTNKQRAVKSGSNHVSFLSQTPNSGSASYQGNRNRPGSRISFVLAFTRNSRK